MKIDRSQVPASESPSDNSLDAVVRSHVLRIYHEANGNITATAAVLGLSKPTVRKYLARYVDEARAQRICAEPLPL